MKNVLVADVMTRSPVTAKPDESLYDCAKKMVRKRLGAIVISDNGKVKGFISGKDILWALVKKPNIDLKKVRAKDVSPKKVTTLKNTDTLDHAIKIMKKKRYKKFPVIGKNKELLGIVTIRDILNFHPEIYPELEEFERIREEQEKLKRVQGAKNRIVREGVCEECGRPDVVFYRINGMLVCESCASSI